MNSSSQNDMHKLRISNQICSEELKLACGDSRGPWQESLGICDAYRDELLLSFMQLNNSGERRNA